LVISLEATHVEVILAKDVEAWMKYIFY
jgi:hypothetical protein